MNALQRKNCTQKKRGTFVAFIGTFEVFDYLILPNYNE